LPTGFGERPATAVLLKVTHRLGALSEVLAAIAAVLPSAPLRAHLGSGVIWVSAEDLDRLDPLRASVAAFGGKVVVVRAPVAVAAGVDVWGPVSGLDVMRRIKERFDPDGRMSPGRFVGGL
jgi:glycolate oxidase FAD binding subunit